ncbi:hypothetical protein Dimus_036087 [Dionaea muscipula]
MSGEDTANDIGGWSIDNSHGGAESAQLPPPLVPPPKPSASNSSSLIRFSTTTSIGLGASSRRGVAWPAPARTLPSGSRPSSPRSHCESEGYNSADEQNPCFGSSYYDLASLATSIYCVGYLCYC